MFTKIVASLKFGQGSIFLLLLLSFLFAGWFPSARADTVTEVNISSAAMNNTLEEMLASENTPTGIPQLQIQNDPLNSPYPIPWHWIMETQAQFSEQGGSQLSYYRTPPLVSPDGKYAAYTRISLHSEPELYRSRVTAVMFLENLETGELHKIKAASPIARYIAQGEELDPGMIDILLPVSWSEHGDRILSRQFEGFFSTSDASDYAVIWDKETKVTTTLMPQPVEYTNAILLGWSNREPEKVLFRAGILGEEEWPLWAVDVSGKTTVMPEELPIVFGQLVYRPWTGIQTL